MLLVEDLDDAVGEVLPPDIRVGVRLVSDDRQACVQQQNALLGPGLQIPVVRALVPRDIRLQLGVHVLEARGDGHPGVDGEAESVGLAVVVVRILPDDDDLQVVPLGVVERREDLVLRREHLLPGFQVFLNLLTDLTELGARKLLVEGLPPLGALDGRHERRLQSP